MYKFKIIKFDKIEKKKIYLDYISHNDLELIRIWRNDQINILRQSNYIKKKKQINYFQKNVFGEIKKKFPKLILLSIKNNNLTIGYCGYVNISWHHKRAEISFLLDTKFKTNKLYEHIMKTVFKRLFYIGFKKIGFNKIFTETFVNRKKHIKILKKLHMREEGKLKKQYFKNKKYINTILHAKFK